ncbi:MAG: MarR family winged helix-turn-helix transcriptional regulator [Hydrogenophaga sp.]|jgi:DNA-binding MarR family transcriptional regulator|uniref:MarR family winged helix-turn-helix transcriptional regulator n=1 Tax=unclassified Hydrogenophaga TaxID=2610897 RepID=UPI0036D398FF
MKTETPQPRRRAPDAWRLGNAGRVLGNAVTRFESRVLELMAAAGHADTRLSHVNLTRHLDLEGTRITELARRARMTNAAMTELIDQCEGLGLVQREADPTDKRARMVKFTEAGREWLKAFGLAVKKAEREMLKDIGPEAAEVLLRGLARYAGTVESIRVADEGALLSRSPRSRP